MPRTHAVVFTSVWTDDADWLALTADAQRLYWLLLSQPKLTLIGVIDYVPKRWARMASDTTLDSIKAAIDELEASPSRFVLVDHDTDELLIRTFVKHDIEKIQRNQNLLRGLWNAWAKIQSRQLRLDALQTIPASVWNDPRCQPHPEAAQIRRSAQLEPAVKTHSSNPQSEPSLIPNPESRNATAENKQPGNSRSNSPSVAAAVDNSDGTEPSVFDTAISLLVDRELARTPTRGNRERHAAAVRRGKTRDHDQAARQLLTERPDLDGQALADILEPPPTPPASARRTTNGVDPDHQRADQARHTRDQARFETEVLDTPRADTTELKQGIAAARAHLRPVSGGHA